MGERKKERKKSCKLFPSWSLFFSFIAVLFCACVFYEMANEERLKSRRRKRKKKKMKEARKKIGQKNELRTYACTPLSFVVILNA
jgi:Zn-finger protein